MTKIQLELSEDEDIAVSLFKLKYKLGTKAEAIKRMIRLFKIDFNIRLK